MDKNIFMNRKFLLIGFGKSGYAVANVLVDLNARVIINEKNSLEQNENAQVLKQKGVTIISGGHPLSLAEQHFDCVIKNPGIPYTNPLIQAFLQKHVPVITEIEFGYLLNQSYLIGITGSNGKTTTTTLIRELLVQDEKPAKTAGNIGKVFTEVIHHAEPSDIIVTELSSFQLMGTTTFRPHISVLLNIHEAHLDYHGSLEEYIKSKQNLIKRQKEDDICVYNEDNPYTKEMISITKAKTYGFSTKNPRAYSYFDGKTFYVNGEAVLSLQDAHAKGKHHVENILASITVAKVCRVSNSSIQETMRSFTGVEHRLQYADTIKNRKFYNDSKSTNLFATETALHSFREPVVLLMGGLDRGVDFHSFSSQFKKVKAVFSFGEVSEKVKKAAIDSGCTNAFSYQTMEEVVPHAFSFSEVGDIILLSPGCASWDQYTSFEERGKDFISQMKRLQS